MTNRKNFARRLRSGKNLVNLPSSKKGVDATLIGPYNLSSSLGVHGQINHPIVSSAIVKIISDCKDAALTYKARDFRPLTVGVDTPFFDQYSIKNT
jgi:2-keto-3-deoxy-L-rhamnonate aldolase RhmA